MTFPLSSLSNQLMTDADKELRAQVVLLTESEKERFSGRKMALLECIYFSLDTFSPHLSCFPLGFTLFYSFLQGYCLLFFNRLIFSCRLYKCRQSRLFQGLKTRLFKLFNV